MATMNAAALIRMSDRENRTVTEYPETADEFDALTSDLLVECDDDCEPRETSGEGRSGSERRGSVRYWGTTESGGTWAVEIVNPPAG